MTKRTVEPPLSAVLGAYFFFATLVLWPVFDFLSTALPAQWGRQEWRFGAAGLMAAYLLLPIMGIALAMAMAFVLRHARVLGFLAGLSLAGAAFLLLTMLSLGMDLWVYWTLGTPEGLPSLRIGSLVAEIKHLSGFIALALLGVGGWQASRQMSDALPGRKAEASPPWLGSAPTKVGEQSDLQREG